MREYRVWSIGYRGMAPFRVAGGGLRRQVAELSYSALNSVLNAALHSALNSAAAAFPTSFDKRGRVGNPRPDAASDLEFPDETEDPCL